MTADFPTRGLPLDQRDRDAAADQWADNLYDRITNHIGALTAHGCPPWVTPAGTQNLPIPYNASTGRTYGGINTLLLWAEARRRGYDRAGWVTHKWLFSQQQGARLRVLPGWEGTNRTGQQPTTVVFIDSKRTVKRTDAVTGDDAIEARPVFKTYRLFNLCQIDGLPAEWPVDPPAPAFDVTGFALDGWLDQLGVNVVHDDCLPTFQRSADLVRVPYRNRVPISDLRELAEIMQAMLAYLAILWTGGRGRLNRPDGALETLTAEIGAALVCADFGIPAVLHRPSQVETWLELMRRDKTAIVLAAKLAMDAKRWCDDRTGNAAHAA